MRFFFELALTPPMPLILVAALASIVAHLL